MSGVIIAAAVTNIKPAAINSYNRECCTHLRANSRQVSSNQPHLHAKLPAIVRKHLQTRHRVDPAAHSVAAYRQLQQALQNTPRPLVLDSFCGTGHSTAALARRHPDHLVIGIDKSDHRLAKHPAQERDNYLLLRAHCEDIWQLLAEDGYSVAYHYMLYPNPWPKSGHLKRRIHGHASFPVLLRLGGIVELRSNWQIYVEEFGVALSLAGHTGTIAKVPAEEEPLSLFEQKYRQSGHTLWSARARIAP